MNTTSILAFTLCTLMVHAPKQAAGHPTNGHLCTEIQNPIRCFESDGFCEWVSAECLYRCDLHDIAPDCEGIKDGCAWDGQACIQVPSALDAGMLTPDVSEVQQSDATVEDPDSADVDSRVSTDAQDAPDHASPTWDTGDTSTRPSDASRPDNRHTNQSAQNCAVGHGAPWAGFLMVFLLMIIRRRL